MNLKELRKSKNLTQKELSQILNISRTSIIYYENNNTVPYNRAEQYAKFFEIPLEDFLKKYSVKIPQVSFPPKEYGENFYTGRKYGQLTILERVSSARVKVRCDCGAEKIVRINNLLNGHTTSCGCSRYRKIRSDNTSGVVGVCFQKASQKWQASIYIKGKNILIGMYESQNEAIIARNAAEKIQRKMNQMFYKNDESPETTEE